MADESFPPEFHRQYPNNPNGPAVNHLGISGLWATTTSLTVMTGPDKGSADFKIQDVEPIPENKS